MKACAVLFLLLPKFPFSRRTSPASYLCIASSLINVVSMLNCPGVMSCARKKGESEIN